MPKPTGGLLVQDTHGAPDPGLLAIPFQAGVKPGLYPPAIELIGSDSSRYTVEVVAP